MTEPTPPSLRKQRFVFTILGIVSMVAGAVMLYKYVADFSDMTSRGLAAHLGPVVLGIASLMKAYRTKPLA
jgi:hypothetical protein